MIKHSVIFTLRYQPGTAEFKKFFDAAAALKNIPGVQQFDILKQTSTKNDYDYGIAMSFDNTEKYAAYNDHAAHQQFIADYWIPSVAAFLEIDFENLDSGDAKK